MRRPTGCCSAWHTIVRLGGGNVGCGPRRGWPWRVACRGRLPGRDRMLGLDEVVDGIFGGSPWGLGLVAVAAAVAVAGPRAKPVAKGVIKGYLATTERAREWVAEASEQIQDLYAEAKHEYESELTATDGEHAAHGE